MKEALDSTMHEVRSLTSELTTQAAELARKLNGSAYETQSTTVLHTSEMVTARLAYTDLQLNPGAISLQTKIRSGFYKKFEKARYVLAQSAKSKQLSINFHGNSFGMIDVLQAFELIPFIVLDNAIKYSPPKAVIDVDFSESTGQIDAVVRSLGPIMTLNEMEQLFEQHFRGYYAQQIGVYGAGLGLYVARTIADLHDGVSIDASSDGIEKFTFNSVAYANFRVEICAKR
ncbi:sensor histidine kinase [Algiphilus sp.]|uniref:sensor histidine kinase n=1 Tax=Algiphilus sp. TaxID=1872431 RepID=UPI003BABAA64